MSDLGLLTFYLGIEVHQNENDITLNQVAYATKIDEKSGMVGCNPCHVPMDPRFKLSKVSTTPRQTPRHTGASSVACGTCCTHASTSRTRWAM